MESADWLIVQSREWRASRQLCLLAFRSSCLNFVYEPSPNPLLILNLVHELSPKHAPCCVCKGTCVATQKPQWLHGWIRCGQQQPGPHACTCHPTHLGLDGLGLGVAQRVLRGVQLALGLFVFLALQQVSTCVCAWIPCLGTWPFWRTANPGSLLVLLALQTLLCTASR